MKDKFIEYCISKGDTFTDCVSFYNDNMVTGFEVLLFIGFGFVIGAALVVSLIN